MTVLHNSDHSCIFLMLSCVFQSPWAKCGCSGASVNLLWWGWIQPHEETKEGKERLLSASCCWIPWPAWRKHHNVCSDYPPQHHPSPRYPRPVQHRPSDHVTQHTTHSFHQIRQKLRAAQVCFHLGQRQFPPGCSGSELVHCPARLLSCLSPSIFSIPQSYWGIIFCLEMESVWRIHKRIYPFSKLWKTHVDL